MGSFGTRLAARTDSFLPHPENIQMRITTLAALLLLAGPAVARAQDGGSYRSDPLPDRRALSSGTVPVVESLGTRPLDTSGPG